jgi:SlyX protein
MRNWTCARLEIVHSAIEELEAKITLTEDLLDTLNRTVYDQQRQIDELRQEVRALRRQILEMAPAETVSPGNEIPPHY